MLDPLTCTEQTFGLRHGFRCIIKIDRHAKTFLQKIAEQHIAPPPTGQRNGYWVCEFNYAAHTNAYPYHLLSGDARCIQ
jgi:hypothetical protein